MQEPFQPPRLGGPGRISKPAVAASSSSMRPLVVPQVSPDPNSPPPVWMHCWLPLPMPKTLTTMMYHKLSAMRAPVALAARLRSVFCIADLGWPRASLPISAARSSSATILLAGAASAAPSGPQGRPEPGLIRHGQLAD